MRENLTHEAPGEDVDAGDVQTENEDDKTFAAMGVAKTISTVSYHLSPPNSSRAGLS